VTVSEHALRVLLAEDYQESNVRTLYDQHLYPLLLAHHNKVERIALSDLPRAWRERVGMPADLEEDIWFEFRWAKAPKAALQAIKDQIERCPPEQLTATYVLNLMEQTGAYADLEALRSDERVKEGAARLAPLALLCPKRKLMNSKERQDLLDYLHHKFNLSNADVANLFGVNPSQITRWQRKETAQNS
jgi:hypothetical protein